MNSWLVGVSASTGADGGGGVVAVSVVVALDLGGDHPPGGRRG
ncbi:MAG: hypothetical protein ACR2M5_08185 [Nakamurella sp.]